MFTLTVKEFMDREDFSDIPGAPCIYIVRDADTILYVGKSMSIIGRIWQHLGYRKSPSDLGRLIMENLPQSGTWQIDLLTLADCKDYTAFTVSTRSAEDAETDLIKLLSPCLNRSLNKGSPQQSQHLTKYKLLWNTKATWPDFP